MVTAGFIVAKNFSLAKIILFKTESIQYIKTTELFINKICHQKPAEFFSIYYLNLFSIKDSVSLLALDS